MATTDTPKLITGPQAARLLRTDWSTACDLALALLEARGTEPLAVPLICRTKRIPVAAPGRRYAANDLAATWTFGLDRRRRPRTRTCPSLSPSTSTLDRACKQLSLFDGPEA